MLNKNVCPNCGQLYDPELAKCPLCGTAPQVVETADPVQRKRITEAERKQRRAERREAEQEARRRRRDARFHSTGTSDKLLCVLHQTADVLNIFLSLNFPRAFHQTEY